MPNTRMVVLSAEQRGQLRTLVRASSTPQALARRARLVLRAASEDTPSNLDIADEFDCDRDTVLLWRNRFLAQGIAGLQDAPRTGRPRSFSPR